MERSSNLIWRSTPLPSFVEEGDRVELQPYVSTADFEKSIDLAQVVTDFDQLASLTYSRTHEDANWHSGAIPIQRSKPKSNDHNYDPAWSFKIGVLVERFDHKALRQLMHEDTFRQQKAGDMCFVWATLFLLAILGITLYKALVA